MPVRTRSLEIGDWYQGSSRLKTITAQPITAMRSLPPRPRRSRSSLLGTALQPLVERLAATEARIQVVPVGHVLLAELPAQIDLPLVRDRREVDQAAIDVAQDDPGLLDRLEQAPDLEKRNPHLLPLIAATVARRGLRERLVRLGVGELVLGLAEAVEHGRQPGEKGIGLIAGEVALVDEPRLFFTHACAVGSAAVPAAAAEVSRSSSRAASASPIVRSWPWKARCQWSAGHLRTCCSSGASSSAGTNSSSGRIRTGSDSTRQGYSSRFFEDFWPFFTPGQIFSRSSNISDLTRASPPKAWTPVT